MKKLDTKPLLQSVKAVVIHYFFTMFLIEYVFIEFITDLAKVAICEDSFFQCQKYLGSVLKKKGSSRKYQLVF
jgi:hypothetical protein